MQNILKCNIWYEKRNNAIVMIYSIFRSDYTGFQKPDTPYNTDCAFAALECAPGYSKIHVTFIQLTILMFGFDC